MYRMWIEHMLRALSACEKYSLGIFMNLDYLLTRSKLENDSIYRMAMFRN